MDNMLKSIIRKGVIPLSLLFILINFVSALDNCKSSFLTPEDVPCLILLPVIENTNCSTITASIYSNFNIIYSQQMYNYSPVMCNATFNQSVAGTYTIKYSTGDTAKFTIGVNEMNLWIGMFFLGAILTFVILMHKTRDVHGSSFIYGGMAGILSLIFSLMLFSGFKLISNIVLYFDINYYFAVLMLLFSIYCFIVTYNLVLDYKTNQVKKEDNVY